MSTYDKIRKEQEKIADELHRARLERCIPIAREVLKIINSKIETVAMGEVEQNHKDFQDLAIEIMKMFLEKNIVWSDREFIFQLALQPVTFAQNLTNVSLTNSWNNVISGLFGKKSKDLTISDVDKALKRGDEIEGEGKNEGEIK